MLSRNTTSHSAKKVLHQIRKALLLSYRFSIRRPKSVLALFALTTLLGLVLASQQRILLLTDEMIDPEFSTFDQLEHLNAYFPEKNTAVLIVSPQSKAAPISKAAMCDVRRWAQDLAEQQDNLMEVTSSFGVRILSFDRGVLKPKHLLSMDCATLDDPEVSSIRGGLRALHGSPWGMLLTSPAADDVALQFHFRETEKNQFWLYPSDELKFRPETMLGLIESFRQNVERQHPQIRSTWGGVATFEAFYKQAFDQTNVLNALSVLIILLVMRFLFGTFRSGFLYLISLIAAVAPVYGGMALAQAPLDNLSSCIALMVMIAALEDFMFVGLYLQKNRGPWKAAFRRFLIAGFFTTLTTFVGFGSLGIADLSILRRFGIWAAVGAMFQFITVFYLVPAIIKTFPYFETSFRKPAPTWKWLDSFKNFRLPPVLGYGTALVFFVSLFGMGRIVVEDAPTAVFPQNHPTNVAARQLLEVRGWQTYFSLIFKNPEEHEFNRKLIEDLKKQPSVVAIENQIEIDAYLKKDIPTSYHSTVDQLWSLSGASQRLHSQDSLEDRAIVYVSTQDIENTNRLTKWVHDRCRDKCYLAGSLVSYSEFGERVLSTLMSSLLMSLGLVSFILIFLCLAKDVRPMFPIIISATWGPLAMIFYFVAFQVPIFYITSMFASILVGLAGDNSIQFIFSRAKRGPVEGIQSLGASAILIIAAMSALSTVMFFSHFEALQKLGVLMICGFLLMLFGDIAILRSISPNKDDH
ncbi:hypothetical protein BH10BDE1_BH10BDE1_05110 [soil metagenome]